ncbi:hypothetical protein KM043_005901 [Ampulex compressa]|nr:hypothetical protein KM043_005901 [Ampulex compressa]
MAEALFKECLSFLNYTPPPSVYLVEGASNFGRGFLELPTLAMSLAAAYLPSEGFAIWTKSSRETWADRCKPNERRTTWLPGTKGRDDLRDQSGNDAMDIAQWGF